MQGNGVSHTITIPDINQFLPFFAFEKLEKCEIYVICSESMEFINSDLKSSLSDGQSNTNALKVYKIKSASSNSFKLEFTNNDTTTNKAWLIIRFSLKK